MATYTYPSNAELNEVAQVMVPRLMAARPIFDIMPVRNVDASLIIWEQRDNYIGLQQVRGLNGEPPKVQLIGAKQYQMRPGAYGEFMDIDEMQLTERRSYGSFNTPISVDDLVRERQDQLLLRRLDRIEYIGWTLLTTGTFSVATLHGSVAHTDSYTLQTASAAVVWSTVATATPLADFRAVQLLGRGKGTQFNAQATAYMNRVTANSLLSNTNQSDLAGKRQQGLAQPLSINDINTLFTGEGLPNIVVYDEGYLNDSSVFVPFIPNNKVVIVGRRPAGQPIMEYLMTRNANNPNLAPGPYMKVIDHGQDEVPRTIEVHDGHNGGPAIYFPGSVVILTV
jgi:hypothetical protein